MATADIVDTAVAAGDFKTLPRRSQPPAWSTRSRAPGRSRSSPRPTTPSPSCPAGTVDTLLKDPKGDLTQILTYHVVPGKVMAADVVKLDGQKVKTVQGGELTIGVDGDKVTLTDAAGNTVNVTMTDVEASNGVIHVIDGVLMPK